MKNQESRKRYRGTPVTVVDARQKNGRGPHGQFGRVTPPSAEAVRAALESQMCPFCGRGPFRMVAGHTNSAHGVDRRELRDMAGLLRASKICAPDLTEMRRELLAERGQMTPPRTRAGRKMNYSPAGMAQQRENGRTAMLGKKASPAMLAAAQANGAKRGAQLRKPRGSCSNCGGPIPYLPGQPHKRTCSAECRAARRAAAMRDMRRGQSRNTR